MILSWRRQRPRSGLSKNQIAPPACDNSSEMELTIPSHFRCPISLDLMRDPVTLSTGITYDRQSIEKWIENGNQTCPVTNQVLSSFDQIPNHAIRRMIQDWCVENRSHGIERIPTPRIPVTPYEISKICSRIESATQRRDEVKCRELVEKMKKWAKESERNKRCMVENGAGFVLAASFETFATVAGSSMVKKLLEEILSMLTWIFPSGENRREKLGSVASLKCIVVFLESGDLLARQNAAIVLKEILCLDRTHVKTLLKIDDEDNSIFKTLVKLIREPICPAATKASLMAIYYMICPMSEITNKMILKFLEVGLVSSMVETIVDAEKGVCEKALGVLDRVFDTKQGREEAYKNALMVPLLVKKVIRVSDLATQFIVSILWKLFGNVKNDDVEGGELIVEALQVGAFQKLLVLLQVGCGEKTKEKVSELLKLLNVYKEKVGCFNSSMNFKHLKKPF